MEICNLTALSNIFIANSINPKFAKIISIYLSNVGFETVSCHLNHWNVSTNVARPISSSQDIFAKFDALDDHLLGHGS